MPQVIQPPSAVPGNPWQNQYSPNLAGNLPYGVGGLMSMVFGQQMWPLINGGTPQSQFDAVWKRQHSLEMLQMGRATVSSIYPFQNLGGMNQNSMPAQIAAMMMSQPDGIAATMMSTLLGGNPIQAQMSSLANLQGAQAAGLGTLSGTSIGQLNTAREVFESQFYNQTITPISKESGDKYRKSITSNISKMYGSGFEDIGGLFNESRNNEINYHSTPYNKIIASNNAINKAVDEFRSGQHGSPDSIIKEMQNDPDNIFSNSQAQGVKDAFSENEGAMKNAMAKEWISAGGNIDKNESSVWNNAYKGFRSGKSREDILSGIGSEAKTIGLSDDAIKKLKDAYVEGNKAGAKIMADAVGTKLNQSTSNQVVSDISSVNWLETGKRLTRGVNFNNTYGFNYEDLTGARDSFIKNRMTSGSLNDLSRMFGGGDKATVSMLDSARSLFGNNLTGQQLGNTMSQFLGYDKFDVNDDKSKANFENMARNLKSTAREMNMDPSDLLNLTNQAQSFGQMSPATAKLGGMSIAPIISDEAVKIAAITAHMDSDTVRWMGGTEGMLAHRVQGKMESASQPITKQLAAIRTYFKGDTSTLQKIDAYIGNGNFTQLGYNGFLQSLPANPSELITYANSNINAQQTGFKDLENADPEKFHKLMNVGSTAKYQEARQALALKAAGGGGGQMAAKAVLHKLDTYLKNQDLNGLMNDRQISGLGMAPMWKNLADSGDLNEAMIQLNPATQAEQARANAAIHANAGMEAVMANKMGKMNAPLMTRLMQAMTTGDSSKLTGVLDAFGISKDMRTTSMTMQAQKRISQISGSNTIEDVVTNATGRDSGYSNKIGEFSGLASKFGVKGSDLQAILKTNGDRSKLRDIVSNKGDFDSASQLDIDNFYNDAASVSPDVSSDFDFSTQSWKDYYTKKDLDKTYDQVSDRAEVETKANADITDILKATGSASAKSLLQLGSKDGIFSFIDKFQSEGDQMLQDGKYKMGDIHKQWAEAMKQQDPSKFAGIDFNAEYTPEELQKLQNKIGSPLDDPNVKSGGAGKGGGYDAYSKFEATLKDAKEGAKEGMAGVAGITGILAEFPKLTAALVEIQKTLAKLG